MGEVAACDLPAVKQSDGFHSIGSRCGNINIPSSGTGVTPASPDPHWLAATLAALADRHQVPGAQLAVHHDGEMVTAEFGELEHGTGIPVSSETAFPVGSITKLATATLAMILVADGDLELDAPLAEHLPELDDLGEQLTLCHLLSHTSGFAESPDPPKLSKLSLGRYVREHCRWEDLLLAPGTGFSYSTRNYALVGYLVETITGMSWPEAMEAILLRPLGIDLTTVVGSTRTFSGRPLASGHSVNPILGRIRPVQQSLAAAEAPAGALAMSAVDLVTLGLMHVDPGFPELLPLSFAESMRQAVPGADPFGLADGWGPGLATFHEGSTCWVGHDGNADGTSCYLRIEPAGGWVVALTTNANTGALLWEELQVELQRANVPLGARQRDTSPQAPVSCPAEFVGSYSNGPAEYLVTAGDDGALCIEAGGDLIARLVFYDDLNFVIQDPASGQGQHVGRFLRDPRTNQIEHFQIGGRLASRRPVAVPDSRSPIESLRSVLA
jgi:CubicO group peptidase (beta-lactamase class C family)